METLKTINAELLVRFFSGDCSSEEIRQIEIWRTQTDENNQTFEDFKKVWKSDYKTIMPEEVLQQDWQKIRTRLLFPEKKKTISMVSAFSRVAAVFILMLTVAGGLYIYWNVPGYGRWKAFQTGETVDSLRLPDNSIVYLNNYSSLKYLRNFEDGNRTVSLNGEGFFDVEKDADNPFWVKTSEGIDVRVVGTAFHLQTGERIDDVELNVTEGSVEIQYLGFEGDVSAGNSMIVKDRQLEVFSTPDRNFLSWKTGELKFDQSSLSDIAETLKNHFNEIKQVQINSHSDVLVTTSFKNQGLREVLDELELHFDKKFTINAEVLIISE
ncbi:MAG: FecR family protein [Bacteroidota bacterium]